MPIKCFRTGCPASMARGDSLYRVNRKGVPGVWACADHRMEKDQELEEIVKALEQVRDESGTLPPL